MSLTQVIETTGNALWVSPLTFVEASTPGTGGFIESPNQRLAVQHVADQHAAQLAAVPVEARAGNRLRLGDVAEVVQDHQPLIGDATTAQGPGLVLVVQKTPGADTLAVTRGIQQALDEMRPGLSNVTVDTQVYRPATYLEEALRTLGVALAAGLVLMLVLLALLGAWRAAVVAAVTLPLTVVASAAALSWAGTQLTTMTLLGLAVAAVVAVDDAVVAGDVASRPATPGTGSARSCCGTARRRPSQRSSSPSPRCPCSRSGRSSGPPRLRCSWRWVPAWSSPLSSASR